MSFIPTFFIFVSSRTCWFMPAATLYYWKHVTMATENMSSLYTVYGYPQANTLLLCPAHFQLRIFVLGFCFACFVTKNLPAIFFRYFFFLPLWTGSQPVGWLTQRQTENPERTCKLHTERTKHGTLLQRRYVVYLTCINLLCPGTKGLLTIFDWLPLANRF